MVAGQKTAIHYLFLMQTTGLTLGKFAPLHAGHELLIRTALEENDRVIVIIYDAPEVTPIPLTVRANWIRSIFPRAEVIEAWDGPQETGYTPEIMKAQEDYILALLQGERIHSFYSSEFYGQHVSAALGAVNRQIDPERKYFPVSGTAVRANPFAHRTFLSPVVYPDLILNVVFLGAPSTGKTTLAREAARLHHTVWMPEYGREYWEQHQIARRLTLTQLEEIAIGHIKRENKLLLEANRILFTDTNALITRRFALYYHGHDSVQLEKLTMEAERRYDVFFVCDTDIPYDDTWDRSGEANRAVFQKQIRSELATRKIPYILLSGSVEERLELVTATLQRVEKYGNLLEGLMRPR